MSKIAKEKKKWLLCEMGVINLIEERYRTQHSSYSSFQNTAQLL